MLFESLLFTKLQKISYNDLELLEQTLNDLQQRLHHHSGLVFLMLEMVVSLLKETRVLNLLQPMFVLT